MAATPVPKLFVNGEPGALLTGPSRDECRRWPKQTEVTVPGAHFLPEDSSGPLAAALLRWLGTLDR
jgi:haloalkane dehalogenase